MTTSVTGTLTVTTTLNDKQIQGVVETYLRVKHGWRPCMRVEKGRVVTPRDYYPTGEVCLTNVDDRGKATPELRAAITIMDAMEQEGRA